MIVETAVAEDLPDILALEEHFATQWSEASWRQEVTGEGRLVLIARRTSGEAVGVAAFQLVDDVADLHRIVVAPHQRRRMLLEVDASNASAIQLYQGYGFAAVATRPDYYGPGADALLLERRLEGVDADSVGMWDMEGESDE